MVVDPHLKTQILESIQLQQCSLAQTKHGPKVLQKLQKQYPHIFTSAVYQDIQEQPKKGYGQVNTPNLYKNNSQEYGRLNANSKNFVY